MDSERDQLAWQILKHAEGDIPWLTLREFAEAVATEFSTIDKLFQVYERALDAEYARKGYEDFYVPAIFALAAPKLNDERRRQIGVFLLEKLSEAGQRDEDLLMEVLTAACGALGPVTLPLVLNAIEKEADSFGAWTYLWGLTRLAADAEDTALGEQVVQACMDLLRQAERGEVEAVDAIQAAWTLAHMRRTECIELLRRVKTKAMEPFWQGDFAGALQLLEQGSLDYTVPANLWEEPVEKWLEPRWRMVKKWYEKQESDDYGDDDYEKGIERARLLAEKFARSEQARRLPKELLEQADFIAYHVLDYAWTYVGAAPEELDEEALREVLLEVFPRKITAEQDFFEKVGRVTEAFLRWLETEKVLRDTFHLVKTVRGWSDKIVANGMNAEYWGMAKSFAMQAIADGVDVTDEGAFRRYIRSRNVRLAGASFADEFEPVDLEPPIPIVEHSPKIGRNDPCPCGSGKKYKKCCGSVYNKGIVK